MSNTQANLPSLPSNTLYKGLTLAEWSKLYAMDEHDVAWLARKFKGDSLGLSSWLEKN